MRHPILLPLLACAATLTVFAAPPAAKAKPTPIPLVPLTITVNDSQTYGPPGITNIQSDGKGIYSDGVDGVCANLDTNGSLTVDFGCATSTNPRVLYLFGVAPAPLAPPIGGSYGCTVPNLANGQHMNHLQATAATDNPVPAFQNMTIDATGNTPYNLRIFIATPLTNDPNQTAYRVNYHGDQTFTDGVKASYVVVRRLSATQWNLEPVAPSSLPGSPINAGMLVQQQASGRNKTTITECGFYEVPFSFTLTAK